MLKFIFSCLYFFLPAYFTNMTPPLSHRAGILNSLGKPIDGGRKFIEEPFLGSHKTWRGAVLGVLIGFLAVLLQYYLYRFPIIQDISLLNYRRINIIFFGIWLPLGAVFGDLLFAFVKRRLKLPPGARFIPFDQTNYVIGAAIFVIPFYKIELTVWLALFILTFFLHIVFNRLGYHLKLHQAKW